LHALTLKVYSAASVAEVFAAPALHMITALSFFDPEFAKRTHLVLGSFHKILKGLLIFVGVGRCLVFFAGKASVVKGSALEAITFFALDTSEIIAIYTSIIDEGVGTVGSGAP
jgi:hypothetical protein